MLLQIGVDDVLCELVCNPQLLQLFTLFIVQLLRFLQLPLQLLDQFVTVVFRKIHLLWCVVLIIWSACENRVRLQSLLGQLCTSQLVLRDLLHGCIAGRLKSHYFDWKGLLRPWNGRFCAYFQLPKLFHEELFLILRRYFEVVFSAHLCQRDLIDVVRPNCAYILLGYIVDGHSVITVGYILNLALVPLWKVGRRLTRIWLLEQWIRTVIVRRFRIHSQLNLC